MSPLVEALESVFDCMVFDARDWALCRRDAWLNAMAEVAAKHGWSPENVARLRTLHAAVAEARRAAEQPEGSDRGDR